MVLISQLCKIYKNSLRNPNILTDTCQAFSQVPGSLDDIDQYLDCHPDVDISDVYSIEVTGTVGTVNGTFCNAQNTLLAMDQRNIYLKCNIIGHPKMTSCMDSEGDHSLTFISNLSMRVIYQWALNIVFAVMDGASLRLAKQHDSDFSTVAFWNQLFTTFGTLIPGIVVEDSGEGSGGIRQ